MIHPFDNTLVVVQVSVTSKEGYGTLTTGLDIPLDVYNTVREQYDLPDPEQKMIHMSWEAYKLIIGDTCYGNT